MIRAVLDTNLLVSYLLTNGETLSRIITHWEEGRFVYLQSPQILTELVDVLNRPRLRQYLTANPQILIDLIVTDAEFVKGELVLPGVCRDPKDDKFIACAIEGNANYIVTGDRDLLDLVCYQTVQMVRAWDFLALLEGL
ncbi:MAG: putative toxin-antitoxin system toxin component, PIN family [Chloroflexi bacterium]|nr:putative toxin-antitoxin system toxin component, PIN family [Chloroflexota bacterium]MBK8933372.1 putative toxin-antitoxin system toxin component, PIN family [Chloroflexota bacterium]